MDKSINTTEYLIRYASMLEEREAGIGGPITDGPSSEDIRVAAGAIDLVDSGEANLTTNELWSIIQLLHEVSGKWIDPDADPLGLPVYDKLEDLIHSFGKVLDEHLPEQAEARRRYENLRIAGNLARRAAHYEKLNPPFLMRHGINFSPKVFFGTLLATALFQSGKLLGKIGRMLR